MARRLFYVDQVRGGQARVTGATAEHLRRVLRVEAGQRFELSDGAQLLLGEVSGLGQGAVEFTIVQTLPARRSGAAITLYAALVKFDRFEWLVEKAGELGVATLVPVVAARCDAGLERAAVKRAERWRRIAEESGQQARRLRPLSISGCLDFDTAIARAHGMRLLLDETGGLPLAAALDGPLSDAGLLVGPEGGWTAGERATARQASWTAVSLGEIILRAETAALASASVVQAAWWRQAATRPA